MGYIYILANPSWGHQGVVEIPGPWDPLCNLPGATPWTRTGGGAPPPPETAYSPHGSPGRSLSGEIPGWVPLGGGVQKLDLLNDFSTCSSDVSRGQGRSGKVPGGP